MWTNKQLRSQEIGKALDAYTGLVEEPDRMRDHYDMTWESWNDLYKNDETITKTYGFTSDMLKGKARYVRLNVQNATLQNNPNNNWYTPNVFEVKVFGTPLSKVPAPEPIVKYDFENSSGGTVKDISGNGKKHCQGGWTGTGSRCWRSSEPSPSWDWS